MFLVLLYLYSGVKVVVSFSPDPKKQNKQQVHPVILSLNQSGDSRKRRRFTHTESHTHNVTHTHTHKKRKQDREKYTQ